MAKTQTKAQRIKELKASWYNLLSQYGLLCNIRFDFEEKIKLMSKEITKLCDEITRLGGNLKL